MAPSAAPEAAAPSTAPRPGSLDALSSRIDNRFIRDLPGDPVGSNTRRARSASAFPAAPSHRPPRRRQVHGALYSRVRRSSAATRAAVAPQAASQPAPFPRLPAQVDPTPAAGEPRTLAVSPSTLALLGLDEAEAASPRFARVFAGAEALPGASPWAQCYGGHQFGSWAGQLGDGRAISLCQAAAPAAGELWELQLKGAGATPYSRTADGRAVLRSSLREFVASEAMLALGVPTTRALCLVATGAGVVRDMFYDGRPAVEPGAVVCRVARSFLRFGSFELPASRRDAATVTSLLRHAMAEHYPGAASCAEFLGQVVARTADLVARWQAVGFVHGVLNSDNMSLIGDTIDYGPYAWMEVYDPLFVGNTTDLPGRRYCYGRQPQIGLANCAMLANALLAAGVLEEAEAQAAVDSYAGALDAAYAARFGAKLGLPGGFEPALLTGLTALMRADGADWTNTWRALSRVPGTAASEAADGDGGESDAAVLAPLAAALPAAVAASGDRAAAWAAWLRRYRGALAAAGADDAARRAAQDGANPAYVARNYLLQLAIEAAEKGDVAPLGRLLGALRDPFTERPGLKDLAAPAPAWAARPGVCLLSCSS